RQPSTALMKRMSRRFRSRASSSSVSASSSSRIVASRVRMEVMPSLLLLSVRWWWQRAGRGQTAAAGVALVVHRLQRATQNEEAVEIVRRQEVVYVGQRGAHAGGDGAVVLLAQEGIEPDESMAVAPQSRHLVGKDAHVAAIPPVADDQYHRAL